MLREQIVPVENMKILRLYIAHDAFHAWIQVAEDEEHPVRCVLEHGGRVFRMEQRPHYQANYRRHTQVIPIRAN